MSYDLDLEQRLDRLVADLGIFDKKRMFGGVGYLLNGNMAFGIHKKSLVIRISPESAEGLLKKDFISPFDMTGRPMKGWVLVSPEGVKTDSQLLEMLSLSTEYARTLPKK